MLSSSRFNKTFKCQTFEAKLPASQRDDLKRTETTLIASAWHFSDINDQNNATSFSNIGETCVNELKIMSH